MNWTELGPGIILILLGLTLFLPALLGTGRRKYIEIPLIKVSFAAPNTPGKKIALGSFGLVVFAIGTYLLVAPLQTKEVNPPPSMETPAPNVTSTESSVSLAGTSVSTPTFTPVPLPSETSTQPPTFSVASTPAPTLTPAQALTATPFLDIESGCISSSLWAPFEGQLLTTDDANCWQLIDWGIVPQDGGLSISMGRTSTISHGIYRKIPDNTTVAFRFRIDQMQTVDGLEPRLMFGRKRYL
jgi:hypothetical protein